jgi:hypothetical protein
MSTTRKLHWLVLAGVLSGAYACGGEDTKSDTARDTDDSEQDDDQAGGQDDEGDADVGQEEDDKKPDAGTKQDASAPPKVDAGKVDAGGAVAPPPKAESDAGALRDAGGGGPITPPPPPPSGPLDGDPAKPVVSIPEVPCGPGRAAFGQSNLKIGGRDVILTYPCEKREGAHVTFILNLHGTTPEAQRFYSHSYFAAYRLATSHNLIVLEPKSRVDQWGNQMRYDPMAAAEDRPHLLEAVTWVYEKFSKFNITGMWVAGHSWGSFYAKGFVCDEAIADKVKGVIGQSGGTGLPGGGISRSVPDLKVRANCQDFISQIHTAGDQDSVVGNPDQTAAATKHGCDAKAPAKDLGGNQMMEEWPNCDPGWVHENILMGAHMHTTAINPEVVKHIVERVKATEKR